MGSITRSFANNITTSGVLLPASLTNNSIANVTAYNASIATGNMVLLSSQTASASASISFTLSSDYKEYQFYFINIKTSTGAKLEFNLSTDNGSNYNVTKTSTNFKATHQETDAFSSLAYRDTEDLAQSTSYQPITEGLGTDADENGCGVLTLFNPSSTTYVKHFISTTIATQNQYCGNQFVAGYANTTSALTNIRFQGNSGNMDGTFLMYGIV